MNIFLIIIQLHIDICIHIERMHYIILRCMQEKVTLRSIERFHSNSIVSTSSAILKEDKNVQNST